MQTGPFWLLLAFALAALLTLLWALVYWHEKAAFRPILRSKSEA